MRASETDFRLVECFDASTNVCTLTPDCRLRHLFDAALRGYFQALDSATLADLTSGRPEPERLPEGFPPRARPAVAISMPSSARPLRQAKAPSQR